MNTSLPKAGDLIEVRWSTGWKGIALVVKVDWIPAQKKGGRSPILRVLTQTGDYDSVVLSKFRIISSGAIRSAPEVQRS